MAIAREFFSEYPQEENRVGYQDDLDEAQETLSLCDLPIYSNPADWEDTSKVDRNLSSSDDDDREFFEFSSEDVSASNYKAESIIFCGKLIHAREQQPEVPTTHKSTQKLETETNPKQKSKKRGVFGRKLSSSSTSMLASPAKSRWYLCMFGLARLPAEMELRDIKNRQSRQSPVPMFQSREYGREMVSGDGSRGRGLWGMLRVLGSKSSHHANTMVRASFACI